MALDYFVTSKKTNKKFIFSKYAKDDKNNFAITENSKSNINDFLSAEYPGQDVNAISPGFYEIPLKENMNLLLIREKTYSQLQFVNPKYPSTGVRLTFWEPSKGRDSIHTHPAYAPDNTIATLWYFVSPKVSTNDYRLGIYYPRITVKYPGWDVQLSPRITIDKLFDGIGERDSTNWGPDSNTGGGDGDFDGTSDDITVPELPTLSAVDTGFISVYAPTGQQMKALASYMWSDLFSIETFKKLFADPMETILGLSILPIAVPTDGERSVKIGFVDTGVTMNHAAGQYATVDCGTLSVKEFWKSALDYSPYTKFSLYLPYIGTRQINTDDIMGKDLQIVYHIDIVSGACTAMVKCGASVLYEFSGACATQIPVTGRDWGRTLGSMMQLAGAGITAAATAGATLPVSAGKAIGMATGYTASHVSSAKPDVQRSGAVSGSAGMLGVQVPYLIAELPRQSRAKDYGQFLGYPSNITAKLADLQGYTEVASIHLDGLSGATAEEITDIENRLKEGVIF